MDINYELYKVFYHVASTLSFSEASKQLFISQSAVSQSIKTLERKLDQVLFIRSTKKVQLTPEGEMKEKDSRKLVFVNEELKLNTTHLPSRYMCPVTAIVTFSSVVSFFPSLSRYNFPQVSHR